MSEKHFKKVMVCHLLAKYEEMQLSAVPDMPHPVDKLLIII